MRALYLSLAATVSLLIAFDVLATPPSRSMIEIGGGVQSVETDGANSIQILFRVEGHALHSGTNTEGNNSYYVIGRVRAEAGLDGSEFSTLDIEFEPYVRGWNFHTEGSRWRQNVELSFLGLSLNRDLALDHARTLSVSVIGVNGGASFDINPKLRAGVQASLDILGATLSERLSDGLVGNGHGAGVGIEASLEYAERFKIVIGAKQDFGSSGRHDIYFNSPEEAREAGYNPETACVTTSVPTGEYYYDDYGDRRDFYRDEQTCSAVLYDDIRTRTTTYIQAQARLNNWLSLFGTAQYAVYSVETDTGAITPSRRSGYRLRFGASIRLGARR